MYAAYCGSVGAMLHTLAGGANAVSAPTTASIDSSVQVLLCGSNMRASSDADAGGHRRPDIASGATETAGQPGIDVMKARARGARVGASGRVTATAVITRPDYVQWKFAEGALAMC